MSEKRRKAVDEMFCRNCGVRIKEAAEVCPNCGVTTEMPTAPPRQPPEPTTQHDPGQSSPGGTEQPAQPRQYRTSVSENWWYAVAGGTGLWVLVLLIAGAAPEALGALGGFLTLVAWFGLPLAAYFDMQYVRANSEWRPSTALWVILLAVWLVNIVVGAAYLYRRHEALGTP
jgi:hypothetical protein